MRKFNSGDTVIIRSEILKRKAWDEYQKFDGKFGIYYKPCEFGPYCWVFFPELPGCRTKGFEPMIQLCYCILSDHLEPAEDAKI